MKGINILIPSLVLIAIIAVYSQISLTSHSSITGMIIDCNNTPNITMLTPNGEPFVRGSTVNISAFIVDCDGLPLENASSVTYTKSHYCVQSWCWLACQQTVVGGGWYNCSVPTTPTSSPTWYDIKMTSEKAGYTPVSAQINYSYFLGSVPSIQSISASPDRGEWWETYELGLFMTDLDLSYNNVTLWVSRDGADWEEVAMIRQKIWWNPFYEISFNVSSFTADDAGIHYFKISTIDEPSLFTAESGIGNFTIFTCGEGICEEGQLCSKCHEDCGYCKSARINVSGINVNSTNLTHPEAMNVTAAIDCSGAILEDPNFIGTLNCTNVSAEIHFPGELLNLSPGQTAVHNLGDMKNGSGLATSWILRTVSGSGAPRSTNFLVSVREYTNSSEDAINSESLEITYRCGDGVCVDDENKCTCAIDCGTCSIEDNEGCIITHECINSSCMPRNYSGFCCGNGICDINESSANCSVDCSESVSDDGPSQTEVRSGQVREDSGPFEQSKGEYTGKYDKIVPRETVNFSIDDKNISVEKINIEVNKTVRDVKMDIVRLPESPPTVPARVAGKVYEYFEVGLTNFTNEDIEKATIGFRVDKSWLDSNKINRSTIRLNRYSDSSWKAIPTTLIGESPSFVYYEAQIPGFSYFAITGEETIVVAAPSYLCTPNAERCAGDNLEECDENGTGWMVIELCEQGCDSILLKCGIKPTGDASVVYAILIVIAMGILIAVYLVRRKPKKPKTLEDALKGVQPV